MTGEDAAAPRIDLRIARDLEGAVRLGVVAAAPVCVGPSGPRLQSETEQLCRRLRRDLGDKAPAEIDALHAARRLYRAFGIDPTKTRPSSEALLRRVLAGKELPRISNAVDLCNLLSLSFLLPMGLYDAGKIGDEVTLRRGAPGESYAGIRKQDVRLEGRPVLADRHGPFGNPTSDSMRSSVDVATGSLWMVIFAPGESPAERMKAHVATAQESIGRHLAAPGSPPSFSGGVAGSQ